LASRAIVVAVLRLEVRVVAERAGRHRGLRRDRLAAANGADLALEVVRQADGAAQRDLVRRVAAHDRVVHVEPGHDEVRVDIAAQADAAVRQVRREAAVGHGDLGELDRHADPVELAAEEAEPARLALLDDSDLHAVVQRQAPALEAREQGLSFQVVGGRLAVVEHLAELRVALQHDAGAAPPRLQPIGSGADRVRHDVVAVSLDHLARHGAVAGADAQHLHEARPRRRELELDRVAVERPDARHLGVVVERLLVAQGTLPQGVEADEALAVHDRVGRALVAGSKKRL
jgi:hypothetical protein